MGKFKHNKPQLLYNLPFFQDIRSEKTALFATTAPMFSCFRYHHFVCQVPQSGCGCQLIFTKTLFLMDTMCEKTKIVYQFVFSDLGGPGRSVGWQHQEAISASRPQHQKVTKLTQMRLWINLLSHQKLRLEKEQFKWLIPKISTHLSF